MHHTRRRTIAAAGPMSGIPSFRAPRAGWRRDDPGDSGDGGNHGSGGSNNDTGAGDGKTGGQGDGDGKTPKIEGEFDADRAARTIAAARAAEAKAKADAKAANDRTAAILKAAGLTADGKEDPEQALKAAAEKAEKATTALRDKSLRLSVRENADKAGVDPTATIDSSSFRDSVAELDPDAADYDDQVVAAMKKALKTNPRLAATATGQGPGKQGADINGGGGGQKSKPKNLTDAITAKLGG